MKYQVDTVTAVGIHTTQFVTQAIEHLDEHTDFRWRAIRDSLTAESGPTGMRLNTMCVPYGERVYNPWSYTEIVTEWESVDSDIPRFTMSRATLRMRSKEGEPYVRGITLRLTDFGLEDAICGEMMMDGSASKEIQFMCGVS